MEDVTVLKEEIAVLRVRMHVTCPTGCLTLLHLQTKVFEIQCTLQGASQHDKRSKELDELESILIEKEKALKTIFRANSNTGTKTKPAKTTPADMIDPQKKLSLVDLTLLARNARVHLLAVTPHLRTESSGMDKDMRMNLVHQR